MDCGSAGGGAGAGAADINPGQPSEWSGYARAPGQGVWAEEGRDEHAGKEARQGRVPGGREHHVRYRSIARTHI